MFNKVLIGLRSHPELIILGLMVMIIAMLIIPGSVRNSVSFQ